MSNAISLSAIISPSTTVPGSRNVVVNMWDWDVVVSWNDGEDWLASWPDGEQSPLNCGEGGSGQGLGKSGHTVMFWGNTAASSASGGHNWTLLTLPGTAASGLPGNGFDYFRQSGSRTEPAGMCFNLMTVHGKGTGGSPMRQPRADEDKDKGDDDFALAEQDWEVSEEKEKDKARDSEHTRDATNRTQATTPAGLYLMTSHNFGRDWSWSPIAKLAPWLSDAVSITVDPTSASDLFALSPRCLAKSATAGQSWFNCSSAPGLSGTFSKLLIKDSKTMFLLRKGAVPLRTKDAGATWAPLAAAANLFTFGATMDGALSWSGGTLVLHGVDLGAIERQQYGTALWKSTDDGESFIDETSDLVTISPGPVVFYEKDLYWVTHGEGIVVKRGFDQ